VRKELQDVGSIPFAPLPKFSIRRNLRKSLGAIRGLQRRTAKTDTEQREKRNERHGLCRDRKLLLLGSQIRE
jgi:hypothetical protein